MPDADLAEPFGDERLVRVQLQLYAARSRLRALPDAFEQGRTFCLLNVSPSNLAERVGSSRFPARLLVHAERRWSDRIAAGLAEMGYRVSPPLALMTGAAQVVLPTCRCILRGRVLEGGLSFVGVDHRSSRSLVRGVQELQAISGITALPGWYLRGLELPVLTIAIIDPHGAPIGVGSVQDIGALSAMGLGICVSEPYRGRGLGTLLNSWLLASGLAKFGSERIHEIVDDPTSGSRRMNEHCGLQGDTESQYLFAELRGQGKDS